MRNTTLQLSTFQMEGNTLERWILLHQPKIQNKGEANAAGGRVFWIAMVCTSLHSGVSNVELSMDLLALPGLFLTTLLVRFRFKLTEDLRNDSFSKTTHKVLPFTSKQTLVLVKIPASKQSNKEGTAEQKAVLYVESHV